VIHGMRKKQICTVFNNSFQFSLTFSQL